MNDPIIEKIRETRHQISEEHGHNPDKIVAYYVELQKQYSQRLLESSRNESDEVEGANA